MDNNNYDLKLSRHYTLYNFYYVFFKRWKMFCLLFLFGVFSMFLSALLTKPLYKQVSKVLVRHSPNQQIVFYREMSSFGFNFRVNPLANYIEIIVSREIGAEVVKRYNLDKRLKEEVENPSTFPDLYMKYYGEVLSSPFNLIKYVFEKIGLSKPEEEVEPDYFQMAIDRFLNETLNILTIIETAVIMVEVYGESIEEAADMANFIARRMIEEVRKLDVQEAQTALEFAEEQYNRLSYELTEVRKEIINYLEKNDVVGEKEEKKLLSRKLEILEIQETTELARKDETISRVGELKERLGQEYIPPKTYQMFITQLMESEKEAAVLLDKLSSIKNSIQNLKSDSHRLEGVWLELKILENEARVRNQQMGMLRDIMEKLVIQRINRLSEHDFVIIDEAKPWKVKSATWPIVSLNIIFGIGCGLFLGLFVPYLVEFWRETYTIPYQVEQKLKIPVISTLPELPSRKIYYGS